MHLKGGFRIQRHPAENPALNAVHLHEIMTRLNSWMGTPKRGLPAVPVPFLAAPLFPFSTTSW